MHEDKEESGQTWQLRYLLVLTEGAYFNDLLADCGDLAPRVLFRQPDAVSVVEVTSQRSYSALHPSPHGLIEADLAELRSAVRFLGESFLEMDSHVVGHRWPVLVEVGENDRTGPEFAHFTCSWNHLILRQAGGELADQMLNVAGLCLAHYYILKSLVLLTREVADQILVDYGNDDAGVSVKLAEMSSKRDLIRASEILSDARPSLYWGCQNLLYESIREAWGVESLAASAHESANVTTQILSDRRDREIALQAGHSAAAARRSSIALLFLTLIAGISALAALIDFGLSNGDPTFVPWRLVVSAVLLLLVPVLVFVNRAALAKSKPTIYSGPD